MFLCPLIKGRPGPSDEPRRKQAGPSNAYRLIDRFGSLSWSGGGSDQSIGRGLLMMLTMMRHFPSPTTKFLTSELLLRHVHLRSDDEEGTRRRRRVDDDDPDHHPPHGVVLLLLRGAFCCLIGCASRGLGSSRCAPFDRWLWMDPKSKRAAAHLFDFFEARTSSIPTPHPISAQTSKQVDHPLHPSNHDAL